jgi:hypothetical protein
MHNNNLMLERSGGSNRKLVPQCEAKGSSSYHGDHLELIPEDMNRPGHKFLG